MLRGQIHPPRFYINAESGGRFQNWCRPASTGRAALQRRVRRGQADAKRSLNRTTRKKAGTDAPAYDEPFFRRVPNSHLLLAT